MSEDDHPFDQLVSLPEDRIRLAAAALWFATDRYPDLKPAYYLEALEAMARRVEHHRASGPQDQIKVLRTEIVERGGYVGGRQDRRNPENCYLNRVMDRKTGIPISLSVIWLDLADRLGWSFAGLNMPGHFLIRAAGESEEIIVDPFNAGATLSREECGHLASTMFGPSFELQPEHLAPLGTRDILLRMLGNLRSIYLLRRDWRRSLQVLRRMYAVRPADPHVAAELAQMLAACGQLASGLAVLHAVLRAGLSADQEQFVRGQMDLLHHRIAQTN